MNTKCLVRNEDDIVAKIEINLLKVGLKIIILKAICGDSNFAVETMDGLSMIKINPGIQNNEHIVVKNKVTMEFI